MCARVVFFAFVALLARGHSLVARPGCRRQTRLYGENTDTNSQQEWAPGSSNTMLNTHYEFDSTRWYRSMGTKPVYKSSNPISSPDIRLLPIFPLNDACVCPTGVMPLNIFAAPYLRMMNDLCDKRAVSDAGMVLGDSSGAKATADDPPLFGICMSDTLGGIAEVGVGLEIINRKVFGAGIDRQMLTTVARQRFKVRRVVQEEPYIVAEVEYGCEDVDIPGPESPDDISSEVCQLEREVHQILVSY